MHFTGNRRNDTGQIVQLLRWGFRGIHEHQRIRHRRMCHAERKLKEAQGRLARTERSILQWSRILADLKHERTPAVQPPLWPEEEARKENRAA